MSLNIHGGRPPLRAGTNIDRIHDFMQDMAIDIACLQEVDTRPSHKTVHNPLARLQGTLYPYHAHSATMLEGSGWFGNCVLSRYPITGAHEYVLSQPGKPAHYQDRHAQECRIATPAGDVTVVNTHLGVRINDRRPQADNLVHLIQNGTSTRLLKPPILLIGDFNEWFGGAALIRQLNHVMSPVRIAPSFPACMPIMHLDRLWCKPEKLVKKAYTLRPEGWFRNVSDHLPVIVQIAL